MLLSSMLLLTTVRVPSVLLLLLLLAAAVLSRLQGLSALQVDVYPPSILFGPILQAQLPTQLFDLWLDLLHMARRVVALAHNRMQVLLPAGLGRPDALLQDSLCLFDIESVEVDGVLVHFAGGVVLAEDVVGCLAVVVVSLGVMLLGLAGILARGFVVAGAKRFLGLNHQVGRIL